MLEFGRRPSNPLHLLPSCDGCYRPVTVGRFSPYFSVQLAFHPGRIRSLARGGLDQLGQTCATQPQTARLTILLINSFALWTVLSMKWNAALPLTQAFA